MPNEKMMSDKDMMMKGKKKRKSKKGKSYSMGAVEMASMM